MKSLIYATVVTAIAATGIAHASPINVDQSQIAPEIKTTGLAVETAAGLSMIYSGRKQFSKKGRAVSIRNEQIKAELNDISKTLDRNQNSEIADLKEQLHKARLRLGVAEGAVAGYTDAAENEVEYTHPKVENASQAYAEKAESEAVIAALESRITELSSMSPESSLIPEDQRQALLARQQVLMTERTAVETELAKYMSTKRRRVIRFATGVFLAFDVVQNVVHVVMTGDDNFTLLSLAAATALYNKADKTLNPPPPAK